MAIVCHITLIFSGVQYVLSMMCNYIMVKIGRSKKIEKERNRRGIYQFG